MMTLVRARSTLSSWRTVWAAIVVLAFLARFVAVVRSGGLFGDFGYDDGVYYASAAAFVHGLTPYRDFVVVQPPGILLLLAPFAAIGQATGDGTGMAMARFGFILLGAINAGLVAILATRVSRTAGVVAGLLYAVWPVAVTFERTTILIPPQTTLLLASMLVLGTGERARPVVLSLRRAAFAGALLGGAASFQLWAAVPIAVVSAWLAIRAVLDPAERRGFLGFAGGMAAVVFLVNGPFLVLAGTTMLRQTVLDQLGRPPLGLGPLERLRPMEFGSGSGLAKAALPNPIVAVVALAALAAAAVVAASTPRARLWVAIALAQVGAILAGNVFFPHYGSWPAAMEAVTFGVAVAWFLDRYRRQARVAALARLGLVVAAMALGVLDLRRSGLTLPIDGLRADAAGRQCVAADSPILLVVTGALWRNLDAGCDAIYDPTGTSYDSDRGALPPGPVGRSRLEAPNYQAAMRQYYGGAEAAFFRRLATNGLTPATWQSITCRLPVQHKYPTIIARLSTSGSPPTDCP